MTPTAATHRLGTDSAAATNSDRFRVGTLQYTKAGLAYVFLWLLWGDFCFTLMGSVVPYILPLWLKKLDAPDWIMPIILTTIPMSITLVLNPIISTASDRHRGPRGRRIPFLLFGTPFVTGALVLLAFAPEISQWLQRVGGPMTVWKGVSLIVIVIGVLLALFKIFDTFTNTTFWYLFNDTVPQAFMSRFMALFRVVGTIAGSLLTYFVFEHVLTHTREIFLGAAAVYFVGFTSMCLLVKEGKYPPPPSLTGDKPGLITAIRTYCRECLTHRIYWYFFIGNAFFRLTMAAGFFTILLNQSLLGSDMKKLAMLPFWTGLVSLFLHYPSGALADRFHPLRVMVAIKITMIVLTPLQFIWLFRSTWDPGTAYCILVAFSLIDLPLWLLYNAAAMPMQMRLLPKDRYGQFSSFNALCSAFFDIVASFVVGPFMILLRRWFPDATYGEDFCYRLVSLWKVPFMVGMLVFLLLLYREWKRLGGDSYVPPEPETLEPALAKPVRE